MKTHTTIGWDILNNRATFEMAAHIARHHHERWDGTGYPDGLKGGEIPLEARIMAVADVYDALRSERHYKKAWTHDDAVAYIHGASGSHFDPAVVTTFRAVEERFRSSRRGASMVATANRHGISPAKRESTGISYSEPRKYLSMMYASASKAMGGSVPPAL